MGKKAKKINLTNLNKVSNNLFTRRKLTIQIEGQDFEVLVDEVFRDSKIEEAIKNIGIMMEELDSSEIECSIVTLSNLAIIDQFTDIKLPNDISNKVQFINLMDDLGVLEKIFEVFPESETQKLNNKASQINEITPKIMNILKEQLETQNKQFKNLNKKDELNG